MIYLGHSIPAFWVKHGLIIYYHIVGSLYIWYYYHTMDIYRLIMIYYRIFGYNQPKWDVEPPIPKGYIYMMSIGIMIPFWGRENTKALNNWKQEPNKYPMVVPYSCYCTYIILCFSWINSNSSQLLRPKQCSKNKTYPLSLAQLPWKW